jgi:heme-degrading monooxygenase HmoA
VIAAVSMYRMYPGHYDEMHKIAIRGTDIVKHVKGCLGAVYYTDKEKDEYGSTTLWETKEDYEAFRNAIPVESLEVLKSWSREPYVLNIFSDAFASNIKI